MPSRSRAPRRIPFSFVPGRHWMPGVTCSGGSGLACRGRLLCGCRLCNSRFGCCRLRRDLGSNRLRRPQAWVQPQAWPAALAALRSNTVPWLSEPASGPRWSVRRRAWPDLSMSRLVGTPSVAMARVRRSSNICPQGGPTCRMPLLATAASFGVGDLAGLAAGWLSPSLTSASNSLLPSFLRPGVSAQAQPAKSAESIP